MTRRLVAVTAALCLVAGACGGDGGRTAAPPTSTTTTAPPETTTAPTEPPTTATTEPPPGPTTTAPARASEPAASCPAVPPRASPRPDRPRYNLTVDVRLDDNTVVGTVDVRFTPDLGTDRLVFRLWPNGPRTAGAGAQLDIDAVTVAGRPAPSTRPDAATLVVELGAPLRPGQAVDASVAWRLALPGAVNDRISRDGDSVRLGSFFPILAWEPGVGWATEPATSGFAEASLAATADFTAAVTVPEGLSVLATGTPDGGGRWRAEAVPDFALSVGRFTTETKTVNAPDPVRVTVGVQAGIGESPGPYVEKIGRVLEDFGRRFGAYPWPAYSVAVTPGLSGGIEYPMHVMQGPDKLGRTTSHEVGHMWFYGLVGNNQGRDPWIDEGLATWAEARFEGSLASVQAMSVPAGGRGRAGEPMAFWESRQSIYYRSVYVQGTQAIAALGDPSLVDCGLRHLVAAQAYRVARPADVIAAMATVFPRAADVMGRFGIRAG